MIWAWDVQIDEPGFSARYHRVALDHGLLLRPIWRTLYFMPPYVLSGGEQAFLAQAPRVLDQVLTEGNAAFYALPDAVAPHIAAKRAGVRIELYHIEASFHAQKQQADAVVVEGAGGFIVPLQEADGGPMFSSADLAQRLGLPIILVVGIPLGCLNHALLTQEAVTARGLRFAG